MGRNGMITTAVGIDIGGTGIKGALVDLATGTLVTDRHKTPTPEGGKPKDIIATVVDMLAEFEDLAPTTPVGVCFPAVSAAAAPSRPRMSATTGSAWMRSADSRMRSGATSTS
jgi:polyphosphate glucokinase